MVLLMALWLFFGTATSHLYAASYAYADEEVTDGDILAEWLVRPVGAVGTIAGLATFLVGLPFSVTTDSTEEGFDKLVLEPFEYTFHRPPGHYRADKQY